MRTFILVVAASLVTWIALPRVSEARCGCQTCEVTYCEQITEPYFDNVARGDLLVDRNTESILAPMIAAVGQSPIFTHVMSVADSQGHTIDQMDFHLMAVRKGDCDHPVDVASIKDTWPGYQEDWPGPLSGHWRVSDVIDPVVNGVGGNGCVCPGCEGSLLYRLRSWTDPNEFGRQCSSFQEDYCGNPATPEHLSVGQLQAGYAALVPELREYCMETTEWPWWNEIPWLGCGFDHATACTKAAHQIVNEMTFGRGDWTTDQSSLIPTVHAGGKNINMPYSYGKRGRIAVSTPRTSGVACFTECVYFDEEPAVCNGGWRECGPVGPPCEDEGVGRTLYYDGDGDWLGHTNLGFQCDLAPCTDWTDNDLCSALYCEGNATCEANLYYLCMWTSDNGNHCRYRRYVEDGGDCDDGDPNIPTWEAIRAGNCADGIDNDCDGRVDLQDGAECRDPCRFGCPIPHIQEE